MWKGISKINSQEIWTEPLQGARHWGRSHRSRHDPSLPGTLTPTECLLCTMRVASYLTWLITKTLRTTEESSTAIPILEIRKLDLAWGPIARRGSRQDLNSGILTPEADIITTNLIPFQRTFILVEEQKHWERFKNRKDFEKNHLVSYVMNLISNLGLHQQKLNQMN